MLLDVFLDVYEDLLGILCLFDGNKVAWADLVGWNVHQLAVHKEHAMANHLTRHATTLGKAKLVHDVIETELKELLEEDSCITWFGGSFLEVVRELLLHEAIEAFCLLLLTELDAEWCQTLSARWTMLARSV